MIINIGTTSQKVVELIQQYGKIIKGSVRQHIKHVLVHLETGKCDEEVVVKQLLKELQTSPDGFFIETRDGYKIKEHAGTLLKQVIEERTGFTSDKVELSLTQLYTFESDTPYFYSNIAIDKWDRAEVVPIVGNCEYQVAAPVEIVPGTERYFVVSARYPRKVRHPVDCRGTFVAKPVNHPKTYRLPVFVRWEGEISAIPIWDPAKMFIKTKVGEPFDKKVFLNNNTDVEIPVISMGSTPLNDGGPIEEWLGFALSVGQGKVMQPGDVWEYSVYGTKTNPTISLWSCYVVLSDGKRVRFPVTIDAKE